MEEKEFQEGDDLWDIIQHIHKTTSKMNYESTHFVLGSKFSGKTSLILRFLDRDESPVPSIALEYTYGRRTIADSVTRQICHIWELAGGAAKNYLDMVVVPLGSGPLKTMSVILVLDLSQPSLLWAVWETAVKELKTVLSERAKDCTPEEIETIKSRITGAYGPEHPDKQLLSPLLTKFVIFGGKYDLFKELPIEQRTVICKTLRFLSHIHGATLQFFTTKSEGLCSRARSLLSHLAFDAPSKPNKTLAVDPNKPLLVPMAADTLAQIGAPTFPEDYSQKGVATPKTPLELWKKSFCAYFPQESVELDLGLSPSVDPKYSEPKIDTLKAKKDAELQKIIRERKPVKLLRYSDT
ncbi:Cytoplasmic dynein 2 light intermediate chain 1-like [Oopsacas minuta]|uniref:Cytoplasmic dynein 2 light intermediate chain 1 n=1 Tax=Oopsacas minuta TaxID=111878 RepID=A0AAV7K105_9METZ|nr:Cytoplasmic dynein 2 light intermediate chain 1-like [Oopsacas minuta]